MAEACSLTALHGGCPGSKVCGYRTLEIKNPEGEVYEVAHEQCKSIVYAQNAFSLLHLQRDLLAMGVRDLRVDFLTRKYEQRQIWDVLDAALVRDANDAQPMPGTHTANFLRRLL
jgi:putative protease